MPQPNLERVAAFIHERYPELGDAKYRIVYRRPAGREHAYVLSKGEYDRRTGKSWITIYMPPLYRKHPREAELLLVHELAEGGEQVRRIKRSRTVGAHGYSESSHRRAVTVTQEYSARYLPPHGTPEERRIWQRMLA